MTATEPGLSLPTPQAVCAGLSALSPGILEAPCEKVPVPSLIVVEASTISRVDQTGSSSPSATISPRPPRANGPASPVCPRGLREEPTSSSPSRPCQELETFDTSQDSSHLTPHL